MKIPVKTANAQTRREAINVNVKLDGKNMKMERTAQRTLMNAFLKILVDMEIAQIQRVVSYATVTQAGEKKKMVGGSRRMKVENALRIKMNVQPQASIPV